jgi:hypothetical protein
VIKFLYLLLHLLMVVLLTVTTQVGGLCYVAVLVLRSVLHLKKMTSLLAFLLIYGGFSWLIVPILSPVFGRVPLPVAGTLRPLNIMTCALNRHYVTPQLKRQLAEVARKMNDGFPGTDVNYLDANFPFFIGFPLFPHLSHDDGKKVDLAFFYTEKASGERSAGNPSFIGYGAFDAPLGDEVNYPEKCSSQGFAMYNMLDFMRIFIDDDKYEVDVERTTYLIRMLAKDPATSKIFIEPHLKTRWNLKQYKKIRFQGCHSVRHDDHIHSQVF